MKIRFTPLTYLRYILITALSLIFYSNANAQVSELCGPIVTLYQTTGNATTKLTEIKKFNQFAQTFVSIGTFPGVTNLSATNSAYNYKTQLIYSIKTSLSNIITVYDPANNFAQVGEITLNGLSAKSGNNLFAKGDSIGYINSSTLVMVDVLNLDFSLNSTYTLNKNVEYREKTLLSNPGCADYSMVGDYIYGVKNTTPTIFRIKTSTGEITSVNATLSGHESSTGTIESNWGATWQDINGNFYAFNNTTGEIFRVDNIATNYATNVSFYRIFKSAASGQNDGFGCELVPDLLDWDGDGVNDLIDLDDDNDGILDTDEGYLGFAPGNDDDIDGILNYLDSNDTNFSFIDANSDLINDYFDTDLDGIPDAYDFDSDNDGCYDSNEAYAAIVDTNGDGAYGGTITVNAYGLVIEAGVNANEIAYTLSPSTNTKVRTAVNISYTDISSTRINNGANTIFTVSPSAKSTTTFTTAGVPDYTGSTAATSGFTYQWQEKATDTWSNLIDGGIYSGSTTSELLLTGVGFSYENYQYRVIISHTDIVCTETSSSAVLNVNALLSEASTNGTIAESVVGTTTTITDQLSYPLSTEVTLTGVPTAGYMIKGWKVDNVSTTGNTDGTLTLTMDDDISVEAEFQLVCAWRSTVAGDWSDNTTWEAYGCETDTWEASPSEPNNDRPIYVFHNVTIQADSIITADSLIIETTGRLEVCGQLTIDNEIIFKVDSVGKAGQLKNNCGAACTVTMNSTATAIVRKAFDTTVGAYPWNFISLPFEVTENSIFLAGTTTSAVWGDLTSDTGDFYIARYNGENRANVGIVSGSSSYANLPSHTIQANTGYILAMGDNENSLDFKSVQGVQFACDAVINTEYYSSIARGDCDHGWNLVGAPFVSGYDLINASGNKPYYVFNSSEQNYTTVISTDNYTIYPFSSFFVQNLGDATGVTFAAANQTFKAVKAMNSSDEISVLITNSVATDKTRIQLHENSSESFERYKDAIKLMSPRASNPQIYTEALGSCSGLAFNSLPLNTTRVNLKVRTGKKDSYTISMTDKYKVTELKQVILVDSETSIQTDLMTDTYTYNTTSSSTSTSSRFYILLTSELTTGLNNSVNQILLYNKGNNGIVTGMDGLATVKIYDTMGKLIKQYSDISNDESFAVGNSGLYIVEISTASQKYRTKLLIY